MTRTMRILTFLMLAVVVGTGQAWAEAESNPRVKFIYASAHGTAFASEANGDGVVTITITPDGDWRCSDGDVTAKVSANTNMAQAPRRTQAEVQIGDAIGVTFEETNVFTLTLPDNAYLNATVTISFSEKLDNVFTVSLDNWTYGEAPKTPQVENNQSGNEPTYTYSNAKNGDYSSTVPSIAGTHWVKASIAASTDYKACESEPFEFLIDKKSITINEASVNVVGKEYDGTNTATLNGSFTFEDDMIVGSDDVSINADEVSATFEDQNAGSGKSVNVTGFVLTGADMNNYDLRNPYFTTTGDITKKDLTVTANDHTIDYGEEPDNDGVTYNGFVNGEDKNTSNIFGESTLTYAYNKQADGLGAPYTTSSPVDKYYIIPSGLTSNNYNIIFQPGTLTVNQKATISVVWVDDNNVGGLRPGSLEFRLLANGVETERTVTLNESINWTATVNGLTPNNSGNLIQYTWSLVNDISDNYELGNDTQNTTDTGATATFTYIRKTGSLTVTNNVASALAADADEEFRYTVKLTPANITGTYGDMEFTDGEATVTLKAGESATATGLMYGTTYTVTQTEVEGFTTSPDFTATGTISTSSTQATFTNTRETGSLVVTNTVYPSDDKTPFTFTVTLTNAPINGTYGGMTFEDGVATVTLKGGEYVTVEGLPTTVDYTVTQTANNDFSTTKTGEAGTISTTQSEAAFKNIKLTDANFEIVWRDGGNTSSRPTEGLTTALLSKLATNGGDPLPVEGQGTITLNEGNNWNASVPNLPMYNEEGSLIIYSWKEIESVPSGYLLTLSATNSENARYTYTLKTSATVKIEWDDEDNQDGIRPETLTATLKDDSEYSNTVTLNSTNSWTATVEDLPKYKVDDSEITYTWTQNGTLPEGYASTNPSIDGIVTTITNSHTPEETEVNVSMVWDDNNNVEGFRPESVYVHLKKGDEVIDGVVLNADNSWTQTWTKLDKYDNGTAINYTVTEDEVANYTPQITKADGTFTYTVTNSRTVEETEATVKVVWVDGNNELHNRPASVTATLLADGTATENTVTMNAENDWTATVTVQKYSNATAINYTWTQDVNALPEGYIHTNSSVAGAVTTFTDSYYPAVTVTITGHHNETTYDGTEHIVSGYEAVSSYSLYTEADFTFNSEASASQTNAGTKNMGLAASQFENTNVNYNNKVTFVIAENGDGYQTITPASVTVKANDKSKEWGTATDPTLTATVTGMVNDEDASKLIAYTIDRTKGDFTGENENSGEYTITPTGDATQGNYAVTYETGKFTITGKPVTIKNVNNEDVSSVDNAYTVTEDQDGTKLTLVTPEASSNPAIDFQNDVKVDHVELDRVMVKDRAETVMLPFSIDVSKVADALFYNYSGVAYDNGKGKWVATMTQITSGLIAANTPYMIKPNDNTEKIDFNPGNNEQLTLNTTTGSKESTINSWTFQGVYEKKVWSAEDCGHDYGFAACNGTGTNGEDVKAGDFVKLAAGAWINPTRSFLTYTGTDNPFNHAAPVLPESISVVLVNADGTATEIDELGFPVKQESDGDWYSLDGRKLQGKPTQKGLYIQNGRTVVVK